MDGRPAAQLPTPKFHRRRFSSNRCGNTLSGSGNLSIISCPALLPLQPIQSARGADEHTVRRRGYVTSVSCVPIGPSLPNAITGRHSDTSLLFLCVSSSLKRGNCAWLIYLNSIVIHLWIFFISVAVQMDSAGSPMSTARGLEAQRPLSVNGIAAPLHHRTRHSITGGALDTPLIIAILLVEGLFFDRCCMRSTHLQLAHLQRVLAVLDPVHLCCPLAPVLALRCRCRMV